MPDLASHFALGRFLFCSLLAAGGGVCAYCGYRLFRDGSGLYKSGERIALKAHEFSISVTGMSAGGFLMLTSAAWGFFAYSSVPRLELAGDNVKIVEPTPKVYTLESERRHAQEMRQNERQADQEPRRKPTPNQGAETSSIMEQYKVAAPPGMGPYNESSEMGKGPL
jgi:hypothetical protein